MIAPSNFKLMSSWIRVQLSGELLGMAVTGQNRVVCLSLSQSLWPWGGDTFMVKAWITLALQQQKCALRLGKGGFLLEIKGMATRKRERRFWASQNARGPLHGDFA